MKNYLLTFSLVAAAVAFQACTNTEKTTDNQDSITNARIDSAQVIMADNVGRNNNDTAQFMNSAAIGGKMEVEFGKMAQTQSSNAKVKEFGAMMVKDHTKANEALKSVAEANHLVLDDAYPADLQTHVSNMKTMTGLDFDRQYMKMMVRDHVKDVLLFKAAVKHPNASISNFAAQTLPVLEMHHKKAIEINESLPQ